MDRGHDAEERKKKVRCLWCSDLNQQQMRRLSSTFVSLNKNGCFISIVWYSTLSNWKIYCGMMLFFLLLNMIVKNKDLVLIFFWDMMCSSICRWFLFMLGTFLDCFITLMSHFCPPPTHAHTHTPTLQQSHYDFTFPVHLQILLLLRNLHFFGGVQRVKKKGTAQITLPVGYRVQIAR